MVKTLFAVPFLRNKYYVLSFVSAPPDPYFIPREVDDSLPVINWSDLSDEQDNSDEDRRLPRNPFIDNEAIEGEYSNSSGDESCIIKPVPAKRRQPLVSYSDSD